MIETTHQIAKKLVRRLGDEIEAVYLFGSLAQGFYQPDESNINLLAVVNDGTSIHALRNLFQPLWAKEKETLKHGPMIARRSDFSRHIQLYPLFAHHLARDGELLFGAPDFLGNLPQLDKHDAFARLAWQAMNAAGALMPTLLDEETAVAQTAALRRLARQVRGTPVKTDESPAQLFAHIQHLIAKPISKLPAVKRWPLQQMPTTTSPILPGLQAIYRQADSMVLVFARLTPQDVMRTNWALLAERLADQCTGVKITTGRQLCLAYAYERPLDIKFQRLTHSWGLDIVSALQIANRQVIRHAARTPSTIQIDTLPHSYLTEPDDKIHDIIHDFQNKLLNVQLEHELLVRFGLTESFTPPEPLPERAAPPPKRIDAIFQHLGWWSDYYAGQLNIKPLAT